MCNVAGVLGKDAGRVIYNLLIRGQYRGEHAASVVTQHIHNKPSWYYLSRSNQRVNYHELVCTNDERRLYCTISGLGQVKEVINDKVISDLYGDLAIGGNRYPTTGADFSYENAKNPRRYKHVAFGENGDIINASQIRSFLSSNNYQFASTSDVEDGCKLFHYYYTHINSGDGLESMKNVMRMVKGGYFFVALTPDSLLLAKDFNKIRYGGFIKTEHDDLGQLILASSESSAPYGFLDLPSDVFEKQWVELGPGEIYEFFRDGEVRHYQFTSGELPSWINGLSYKPCHFDPKYIMRPDSIICLKQGLSDIYSYQKDYGFLWVKEVLPESVAERVDLVIPVLDSGICYALGVTDSLRNLGYDVSLDPCIIKNKYDIRTFLQSVSKTSFGDRVQELGIVERVVTSFNRGDSFLTNLFSDSSEVESFLKHVFEKSGLERSRREKIRIKHSPVMHTLRDKNVLLIDDTIIRLNTGIELIKLLKEKAGVLEVYFGVMDDLVMRDCPCAVDFGNNLIAHEVKKSLIDFGKPISRDMIIKIISVISGADQVIYSNALLESRFFNDSCQGCLGLEFPPSIYLRKRDIHG